LRRFGHPVRDDFGPHLDRLLTQGLIEEDDATVRPTPKGFELNNEIGLVLVG
jgi:coproporphyrinogen III oxidase-like Fe-S oxidoreductase